MKSRLAEASPVPGGGAASGVGRARGPATGRARRIAYVTPFRMPTNAYIEMQKALAAGSGFETRPLSLRHLLFEGGLWGLMVRRNIVLVQWLEMRAFRWIGARPRLSLTGLLVFLFYLALLGLVPAQIVYFVHDHAVHDTEGGLRSFSQWLVLLCRRVADHRVVHDPRSAQRYRATYLPHPLFWDRPASAAAAALDLPVSDSSAHGDAAASSAAAGRIASGRAAAPLRCAMLGAIRPYKSIDTILAAWPPGRLLTIAGRGSPELVAQLREIVRVRALGDDVELDSTHQSDAAFARHLQDCDVLILPHASDTALVSGAFFEALGRVPWILARRSSFMDWAAGEFAQVLTFEVADEIPALLDLIDARRHGVPSPAGGPRSAATLDQARQAFGWEQCRRTWGAFFARLC